MSHDKTLTYRGSGSDLATDIRAMLSPVELVRLLADLSPVAPPAPLDALALVEALVEAERWWAAKCSECGWRGLDRDCAVPGTSDPLCPVCISNGKRVVVDDDKPGVPEDVVGWLKILLETDFTFRNMMPKETHQLNRLLDAANKLALWVEKTFAVEGVGSPAPNPPEVREGGKL